MCSTPKAPKTPEAKKPQYVRNPYLDGLAIAQATGRNSLRIDLDGTGPAPAAAPRALPAPTTPTTRIPTPVTGGRSGLAIPRPAGRTSY